MKLRKMRRRAHQKRGFGYGKRCKEYYPGCIICEAWRYYDNNKRWPTFEELWPLLKSIRNENQIL